MTEELLRPKERPPAVDVRHERLQVLGASDPKKARALALEAFGLDKIDDQAICERFEEMIEDAIYTGDNEIELPTDFAELLALILKSRKRPRGRQQLSRRTKFRQRMVLRLARQHKAELMESGQTATQAESAAADKAAAVAQDWGIKSFGAETIRRRMQSHPDN